MARCKCGSRREYKRCCGRWHGGTPAPTPEDLMRSRYSAYALGLADYILDTTHPDGPHFDPDRARWRAEVAAFSTMTTFRRLDVLDTGGDDHEGFVHFQAHLSAAGRDSVMDERSRFLRLEGRWLYHSG